jgi:hypothetical protein
VTIDRVILPPPPHVTLAFTSTSPIQPTLDGPYVLRITAIMSPPLVLTQTLGSVPTRIPSPPPATYIVRSPHGPPYSYTLTSTAPITHFVVRITGPDGAFVERTV